MRHKVLVLIVLILSLAGSPSVLAATLKAPTGITLSPAYSQIKVSHDQSSQAVVFSITNNEPTAQNLTLKTADFKSINDNGGLLFVGTKPGQSQQPYSLANWLNLPQAALAVPANQTVKVTVTVQNRADFAPGGHYGALLIYIGNIPQTGANQVGVEPVATALMFVTKTDGATYKLALQRVSAAHNLFKLPDQVSLSFLNDGNSFVTPRGFITILDPNGKLVSKGIINEDSLLVLPGGSRKIAVPLSSVAHAKSIGRYKLTVNFRFDGFSQYRQYDSHIFLATPWAVLVAALGLALLTGLTSIWLIYRQLRRPTYTTRPVKAGLKSHKRGS